MKILITNDDGVHAQGIIQLAKHVRKFADVFVVAPSIEQSGVSQAITFLSPLFPVALGGMKDSQDNRIPGFSVNGTPVDCVKLALSELCPWKPDLVLSGINGGLNAGVNVCYSGTVGAALAASTFGILSMAISLETSESMDFESAADIVTPLIERFSKHELPPRTALNINVPTAAIAAYSESDGQQDPEISIVPVETNPMGFQFNRGIDPKGRDYYWSTNNPRPKKSEFLTDTESLLQGKVTVSAISYDLNSATALEQLTQSESSSV